METDQPIHKADEDRFGRRHFAKRIAEVVGRLEDNRFFGLATYSQAAALIRHLLHRIDEQSRRESLAADLAKEIEPLPFAYDYLNWLRRMKRSHYSDEMVSVISSECEDRIRQTIVDRMIAFAINEPIEREYPLDAQGFYRLWSAVDKENPRKYLTDRFAKNSAEIAEFICAVKGVDPGSETLSDWSEDDEWFGFIYDLVQPAETLDALRETYPSLASAQYQFLESTPMNAKERAARWFQRLYLEKSKTEPNDNQMTDSKLP